MIKLVPTYDREWGEYRVVYYENGKRSEAKTWYGDEEQDMWNTFESMVDEAIKQGREIDSQTMKDYELVINKGTPKIRYTGRR